METGMGKLPSINPLMKRNLLFLITTLLYWVPVLQAQTFNITDFGAVPGGKTLNSEAIQAAVDSCTNSGGGTVYVPADTFLTGTFDLKSNVNLYLESGAVLLGSPNLDDYRPYKAAGYDTSQYGIIYAEKAENVSISGFGTIDGNEEAFFHWDEAKSIEWGGVKHTRQKEDFRKVESGIGDGPVKPKDRPRQMVIFSQCKNVTVKDVSLNKSPFWTLHFADCDGVVATNVKIWTSLFTPNSDGIGINSCNNVKVSNCDIRSGDDAIAITGYAYHFENPGFHNLRHKSENITITNCNLQSRSSGIRIGFQDQNTVRNIHINNVNISESNRGIGIFVRDEGSIENVTVSQVHIETRLHTGDWWGNGEPIHISAVRGVPDVELGHIKNVTFRDVTLEGENGILVYGSEENRIQDLRFNNLRFTFLKSELNTIAGGNIDLRGAMGEKQLFESDISAFYAQYVDDLSIENAKITWDEVEQDYFRHGLHITQFTDLKLADVVTTSSPTNPDLLPVIVENGKQFETDLTPELYRTHQVEGSK